MDPRLKLISFAIDWPRRLLLGDLVPNGTGFSTCHSQVSCSYTKTRHQITARGVRNASVTAGVPTGCSGAVGDNNKERGSFDVRENGRCRRERMRLLGAAGEKGFGPVGIDNRDAEYQFR